MGKFNLKKKIILNRKVYIGIFSILCSLSIIYFSCSELFNPKDYSNQNESDNYLIGTYIDGEYSGTIPGKNDGYAVEKVVCDNNATGTWDNDSWGLLTTNLSKRTKCNIYFKKGIKLGDTVVFTDTTGKCPTVNEDGSAYVYGVESENALLCSAPDAYGTSYYFRGTVENNYVYFAGFYWRIVRINGDGSIRIIYDGTSAHANGDRSEDRQIGTSAFNSDDADNAHIGYMYGDADGIVEGEEQYSKSTFYNTKTYYIAKEYVFDEATKKFSMKDPISVLGSDMTSDYIGYYTYDYYKYDSTSDPTTYNYLWKITSVTVGDNSAEIGYTFVRYGTTTKEQAQTNKNSSTIKTYLDNWYKNNISGTDYEQYLADNLFCNDRSFSPNNTGTGAGISYTKYRWNDELYIGPWENPPKDLLLTCPQKNDAFTVSDTTNGNGALTYPIGLLTADEATLAGAYSWSNNDTISLKTRDYEWLLSPSFFDNYAYESYQYYSGPQPDEENGGITSLELPVRAVLNLKANSIISGTGTMTDPYKIE